MEQAPATRPGDAGQQHRALRRRCARHAHDQAEVGDQPVVGAEHGGAERIAGGAAMAALERRDRAPGQAAAARNRRFDDPRVRPLVGRQPARDRFRLTVVGVAVARLGGGDRRQHEGRAEAAAQAIAAPAPGRSAAASGQARRAGRAASARTRHGRLRRRRACDRPGPGRGPPRFQQARRRALGRPPRLADSRDSAGRLQRRSCLPPSTRRPPTNWAPVAYPIAATAGRRSEPRRRPARRRPASGRSPARRAPVRPPRGAWPCRRSP